MLQRKFGWRVTEGIYLVITGVVYLVLFISLPGYTSKVFIVVI